MWTVLPPRWLTELPPDSARCCTLLAARDSWPEASETASEDGLCAHVSAADGRGLEKLRTLVEARLLATSLKQTTVAVAPTDGELLAWLYANGTVTAVGEGSLLGRLVLRYGCPSVGLTAAS